MENCLKLLISIVLFSLTFPTFASNYSFINDTAMSYFTKQDWEIFNKTQMDVLNHGKDGIKVLWQNPTSGSRGYMIPSNTTSQNGMICRTVTFFNTANQINGKATYRYCKIHHKWMIHQ